MNKSEAIRLASDFMSRQVGYDIELTPSDVLFIRSSEWPDLYTNDVWIVHFPRRLTDEILILEPSTVVVVVDAASGDVCIPNSI